MKKQLYPFQETGSQFLQSHVHALLADEPGLGKTVQVIDAAEKLGLRNNLVVCPASVRLNWAQEIEECGGKIAEWRIISYHGADKPWIHGYYDLIVLDEAHFLKTPQSKRTQAVLGNKTGLVRRAKYKWCLTGTPILNRPVELYPLLKTLAADTITPFNTFALFTRYFCGAYFDGYGLNVKGATHLDDLAHRLSRFMLRRTKAEVMPELPPKIVSRVPLMLDPFNLGIIEGEEAKILDRESYLSPAHEKFAQLGDLAVLLRVTGEAKVGAVIGFLEDLLETEEKIVVFARHRTVIERLHQAFKNRSVVYQGGMSDIEKQNTVRIFGTEQSCRLFFGNIQAAGTGINGLQDVCRTVVFAELSWVPGEMEQAIGRCHRIGQMANCVNVYLLHAPGTMESAVLSVQQGKTLVIEKLTGKGEK